jgi:hypothetical protein
MLDHARTAGAVLQGAHPLHNSDSVPASEPGSTARRVTPIGRSRSPRSAGYFPSCGVSPSTCIS